MELPLEYLRIRRGCYLVLGFLFVQQQRSIYLLQSLFIYFCKVYFNDNYQVYFPINLIVFLFPSFLAFHILLLYFFLTEKIDPYVSEMLT